MSMTETPQTVEQTPIVTPPRRRRWWVSLVLGLLIFAGGFTVGGVTSLVVARNQILHAIHHPEENPKRITAQLRRQLDLSDEQTRRVRAIVQRRLAAFAAIRREVLPEVRAQLDLVEKEIAEVLHEDQKARWHARFQQLRGTWMPHSVEGEAASGAE